MEMIVLGKEYSNSLCCKCDHIVRAYDGHYIPEKYAKKFNVSSGDFICTNCIIEIVEKENFILKIIEDKEDSRIFSEEQRKAIEYLIDKEASRGFLLDCIRDAKYWPDEYKIFRDMDDNTFLNGITQMVDDRILTEGIAENEIHSHILIITRHKPNTSKEIKVENVLAKIDPDKYNRVRRDKAAIEEAKRLIQAQKDSEFQERVAKRKEWLEENSEKIK